MQDVKDSVEMFGLLDRRNVGRLLDHTDQALVPRGARAVGTGIDIRDVVTHRAEAQLGFDIADGGCQRLRILAAGSKNVECEPLRALGPYARELLELVDQTRHGFSKLGHQEIV